MAVVAIDLENHSHRAFQGFLCRMQANIVMAWNMVLWRIQRTMLHKFCMNLGSHFWACTPTPLTVCAYVYTTLSINKTPHRAQRNLARLTQVFALSDSNTSPRAYNQCFVACGSRPNLHDTGAILTATLKYFRALSYGLYSYGLGRRLPPPHAGEYSCGPI